MRSSLPRIGMTAGNAAAGPATGGPAHWSCRMTSGCGWSSSTVLVAQVRSPCLAVTVALANERPARIGVTVNSSCFAGSAAATK